MKRLLAAAFALCLAAPALADEPISVTQHHYSAGGVSLAYRAETGRLPILDPATGKAAGEIFFVAYRVPSKAPRPVTFIWNGGPGSPATLLHFEAFGPRRIEGGRFVDNPASLLAASDLVFVDPVGTGFSRAATPAAAKDFYSVTGDLSATAAFIERWRDRFGAPTSPIYLAGESYGVWRSAGTAELLEKRGVRVAGVVLISGGVAVGDSTPRPLATALRIPNRTAAALFHGRLDPSLGTDRAAAVKAAEAWARDVYAPALARVDALSTAERDQVAADLARYTGYPLAGIDRKTLTVSPRQYLSSLLKDQGKTLNTFDMRVTGADRDEESRKLTLDYFRKDLGYRTDLKYVGLEAQTPDDDPKPVNARWAYNSGEITPEVMARAQAGEGPPGGQPWTARAMALDPKLRVLVAAGLYDSLNSCAGNRELQARLDPAIAGRFRFGCYLGGHMMYRDAEARAQLSRDVRAFVSAK